ncbi:MAG: SulP family inorganic anion transporter [Actinobacteria bacterium]|nr:SulP family inorganic anion transporter [Actinomycetota bacterium]
MERPLQGVTRRNLGRELMAGVTLLAISVPLNIGYAQIAGLPATAGLYALILPTVVYALLVSSRQVVASPDAAAAALVFSSLTGLGVGGGDLVAMAAAQAIVGGAMLCAASVLKLGFLADFLSKPILIGFVGGLALEIMLSQTAKILGIPLDAGGEFFERLIALLAHLPEAHPWSLVIGMASVLVLVIGRRISAVIPWALLVLVAATLATVLLRLDEHGVAVLGTVPAGPPAFTFPRVDPLAWLTLIPSALALSLVTMAEGLLVSRSYAEKNGYRTDPNRDLLAFGAANLAAGLSASFTVGSSTSRTAAMDQLRSRTQVPSLVLAIGALLLLLFGTALLAQIPSPAIGAVVAVAVWSLLGIGELRRLWAQSHAEFAVAAACFLGVLVLGPLGGLLLAFVLSLINLARRASSPAIDVLVGSEDPQVSLLTTTEAPQATAPGVLVLRFSGPVFFANGARLAARIRSRVDAVADPLHALVLDLEAVTDVDVTGAESLRRLLEGLRARGLALGCTRLRPDLRDRLAHFGLLDGVTEYPTNRDAVAALATGRSTGVDEPADRPGTDDREVPRR